MNPLHAEAGTNHDAGAHAGAEAAVQRWWQAHCQRSANVAGSGARARLGGMHAGSVGEAFVLGYQEALAVALAKPLAAREALVAVGPGLADAPSPADAAPTPRPLRALSVTEATGNGPRDLRAALTRDGHGLRLRGQKRFATLATAADELWVAAVDETAERDPSGAMRPSIAVVRVTPELEGVGRTPMPSLGFMPEVPHAFLDLDVELPATARLPGDGWAQLVKPFGALEDALVRAAVASYLAAQGQSQDWSAELVAALDGSAEALADFDDAAKVDREAWARLEAAMAELDALMPAVDAAFLPGTAADWQRDQRLFQVATRRRKARLAALDPSPGVDPV